MDGIAEMNVRERTVKDVARLAGVSTATVSRVVNNARGVSCETRTKVLTAIERLQYRPNGHAAELGRANGGIPRNRDTHVPASARRGRKKDFGRVRRGTERAQTNETAPFGDAGIQSTPRRIRSSA